MALGYNEIDYVRSNISRVSTDNSKIKESSETFNYVMNNEEFRKFAEGANLGAEIQEKIQKLLQTIGGDLNTNINNLVNETNSYLDEQASLNNSSIG
ncbi:MAG TPA: hypothetical protein OIM63_01090 [Bacilli bacterium]|jgi:hypothetical protein|nr:hypothetical protein [Bacilli bacterium]